jgi:hypothetical protein
MASYPGSGRLMHAAAVVATSKSPTTMEKAFAEAIERNRRQLDEQREEIGRLADARPVAG